MTETQQTVVQSIQAVAPPFRPSVGRRAEKAGTDRFTAARRLYDLANDHVIDLDEAREMARLAQEEEEEEEESLAEMNRPRVDDLEPED